MPMRPKTHAQLMAARLPPVAARVRDDRPTAAQRGYDARWQRARADFLARNPLCLYCKRQKRTRAATLVDHSVPHKGDTRLFWDATKWVPCCRPCHQHVTAAYDGGHGNPERPRDGAYVPPRPGELSG